MVGRSREKLSISPFVQGWLRGRRGIALLALAMSLCWAAGAQAEQALTLETQRQVLNPEDRGQVRVGSLIYRGGFSITSPDKRFGGLSGLLIAADGSALTAVTDAGNWVSADLIHDAAGSLTGLGSARLAPMLGPEGRRINSKRAWDAEALARLSDGSVVVGFEHDHRIWRYPTSGELPEAVAPPAALRKLPDNNGLEGMVALGDDRLLLLIQDRRNDGSFPVFLGQNGRWQTLTYPALRGFEPSGAARLPDGDFLILERSYSLLGGVSVRLMRLAAGQLAGDAELVPVELALLKAPLTIDNFEAVDLRQGPAGETLVYLLSDDNFSAWQRTLLLQFELQAR